jgi:hypothetical protein
MVSLSMRVGSEDWLPELMIQVVNAVVQGTGVAGDVSVDEVVDTGVESLRFVLGTQS